MLVYSYGGTIELDGATVTTLGKSAYGLSSEDDKSKITAKNNTKVTTNGHQASGVYVKGGVVDITAAEIETMGPNSTGLYIANGELKAKDTKVTTTTGHGAASDGGKLNISGGSVTANGDEHRGVWALGGAIKSLGLGNDLFTDLLRSSRNSTPDYDLLSGEIHATLAGVLIQDSRFISNIAASRLRDAFGDNAALKQAVVQPLAYGTQSKPQSSGAAFKAIMERDAAMDTRLAVWGQTYGSWANAAENGNADGYSRTVRGIVTGLDGAVSDTWRFGLLAGYSTTSLSTRNGVASVNSYHMGAYGGTEWDIAGNPLGLRFGVNLGRHDISTDRQAEWLATVDGNHAIYGATTVQGFGEISYAINTSYGVIEPFAGISHVYLKSDGFGEEGGRTALSGRSGNYNVTTTTLGLRASHHFQLSEKTTLTAHGMVGWNHAMGDVTVTGQHAFAGGGNFAIQGLPIAKDALNVEAGIDIDIGKNTRLGIKYTGQFSQQSRDNAAKANLSLRF